MKILGQKRVRRATLVGASLFALYVLLNVTNMPPSGTIPEPLTHVVALVGGLALMAWARTGKTRRALAPVAQPLNGSMKELVRVLGATIDASDPFARGRSYRFGRFCVRVGEELGLSGGELDDLEYAAMLHDVGRASVDSALLHKPGQLNSSERNIVKLHPRIAFDILKPIPELQNAAEIIHAHHEQPDGNGYPRGLKGSEIPLASSIIMVVAAFDAMTSERPYRVGLSPSEAYVELDRAKGGMFDPRVVEAFVRMHRAGSIFEGFDGAEIAKYARGEYPSRALEDYLTKQEKAGEETRENRVA